jgi:dihydrofolate reductase
MARSIYSMIASLDGYITDEQGGFDWATPDEQVHTFVNERARDVGTYLCGRRLYETMVFWEDTEAFAGQPGYVQEFARLWRAADKIVYSRTREAAAAPRTKVEREFDPGAVRRLLAGAGRDVAVGGPELAAQAMREGLVDEVELYIAPVVVGGGKPAFPRGTRLDLELFEERRFDSGFLFVRYGVRRQEG